MVTVVIPAYNAEEFIEDAVKSCFNQTYRPMETIVVNDGSTDTTANEVKVLADTLYRNDFKLRLIDIGKNVGAANALNVGFSSAEGAYICWLSADDIFIDREKIEKQIGYMKRTGADWAYFRDFYSGSNISTARLVKSSYLPRLRIFDPLFIRDSDLRLAMLFFRNPINGSSVVIKKDCVESYGQFDPSTRNVDGDGDLCDNCVDTPNPDQADLDNDGLGDECDNCPENSDPDQTDSDGDDVGDLCDNCKDVQNPDQEDLRKSIS